MARPMGNSMGDDYVGVHEDVTEMRSCYAGVPEDVSGIESVDVPNQRVDVPNQSAEPKWGRWLVSAKPLRFRGPLR